LLLSFVLSVNFELNTLHLPVGDRFIEMCEIKNSGLENFLLYSIFRLIMTQVYESVTIYSTKPLKSKYRYKDSFQFFPSKKKQSYYYPIILHLALEKPTPYMRFSNNNSDNLTKKIIEKLHLLSLFAQFYFFDFKKRKHPIKRFSTQQFPEITHGKINWYQDKTLNDRNVSEIIVPKEISDWLEVYDNLDVEKKKIFRKALYLFYSGIELKSSHPSQSFMSLVSAIETLINFEMYDPERCSECNQFKHNISKRLKDFIWKYAYNNKKTQSNKKFINALYSKRSNITHHGNILVADLFWDDSKNFVDWKESFLHKDLVGVTRVCLINWMVINGRNS